MTLIKALLPGLAACLFAGAAFAQIAPPPPTQPVPVVSDTQFLDRAMAGSRFEIEAGRLAQTKAQDDRLKAFAARMVEDHGRGLAELQDISRELNREAADQLDSRHRAKIESLKTKDGAAFDTAYTGEMRQAHADTLLMLQSHRQATKHDNIRAWIDKTIPVVQRHKSMIDGM